MNKMTLAAALALATVLPFAATHASAEKLDTPAAMCTEAPARAAKAGIDCAATSSVEQDRRDDATAREYPAGPVNFGNGIVF